MREIKSATLEQLMPQEHFLRDLGNHADFSFVYDKVFHLYLNFGRKSVDPVVPVKMILLDFLYGIDSERKMEREVQVNIAFRWFWGLIWMSRFQIIPQFHRLGAASGKGQASSRRLSHKWSSGV
jgi:transposase